MSDWRVKSRDIAFVVVRTLICSLEFVLCALSLGANERKSSRLPLSFFLVRHAIKK